MSYSHLSYVERLAIADGQRQGQFTLAFDGGSNTTTLLADTDGNGAADFSILFTGDVTALTGTWVL